VDISLRSTDGNTYYASMTIGSATQAVLLVPDTTQSWVGVLGKAECNSQCLQTPTTLLFDTTASTSYKAI